MAKISPALVDARHDAYHLIAVRQLQRTCWERWSGYVETKPGLRDQSVSFLHQVAIAFFLAPQPKPEVSRRQRVAQDPRVLRTLDAMAERQIGAFSTTQSRLNSITNEHLGSIRKGLVDAARQGEQALRHSLNEAAKTPPEGRHDRELRHHSIASLVADPLIVAMTLPIYVLEGTKPGLFDLNGFR